MAKGDDFREWLRQVDLELAKRCGLSHDDLADQPWRSWYEDEMSAPEAAGECLVNEGLTGLAVEENSCDGGDK
jgi:hypothetical protein